MNKSIELIKIFLLQNPASSVSFDKVKIHFKTQRYKI